MTHFRVADKSLARPRRKQATATKPGIYSTYPPRSSIHFLARCYNFCKPLKEIQKFVRPTRSPRQQWLMAKDLSAPLYVREEMSVREVEWYRWRLVRCNVITERAYKGASFSTVIQSLMFVLYSALKLWDRMFCYVWWWMINSWISSYDFNIVFCLRWLACRAKLRVTRRFAA